MNNFCHYHQRLNNNGDKLMTYPEKLVDLKYIKMATSLSRTRIWPLESAGHFPQGRRLTKRCVRWLESDVQAWVRGEWEGVL